MEIVYEISPLDDRKVPELEVHQIDLRLDNTYQ